ncbi:phosphate acyltransferase PlsX [Candidatus Zixiibacteriota bacterium]
MPEITPAIAIDAMGTEGGVSVCIDGVFDYLAESDRPKRVLLVGNRDRLQAALGRNHHAHPRRELVDITHAEEAIEMNQPAADGVKKKDSSIAIAVRLQREGLAGATVSPGHTGAFMASSLLTLGRLEKVSRPAIATFFPTEAGSTLILDVGANPTCKAQNLYEFAIMGSVYCSTVMDNPTPRVALLSNGEERSKGNDLIQASYKLLARSPLNFIGNIEGRDILRGRADVIVCDGFIGNIMLKFAESVRGFVTNAFRRQISSNNFSKLGAILMGPFLRRLHKMFDYAEVGGAPMLGVRGICIVCHGRSSSRAITSALLMAEKMMDANVNKHINNALTNGALMPTEAG